MTREAPGSHGWSFVTIAEALEGLGGERLPADGGPWNKDAARAVWQRARLSKRDTMSVAKTLTFTGWLWKTGTSNVADVCTLLRACARIKPRSPYAMLARDDVRFRLLNEAERERRQ